MADYSFDDDAKILKDEENKILLQLEQHRQRVEDVRKRRELAKEKAREEEEKKAAETERIRQEEMEKEEQILLERKREEERREESRKEEERIRQEEMEKEEQERKREERLEESQKEEERILEEMNQEEQYSPQEAEDVQNFDEQATQETPPEEHENPDAVAQANVNEETKKNGKHRAPKRKRGKDMEAYESLHKIPFKEQQEIDFTTSQPDAPGSSKTVEFATTEEIIQDTSELNLSEIDLMSFFTSPPPTSLPELSEPDTTPLEVETHLLNQTAINENVLAEAVRRIVEISEPLIQKRQRDIEERPGKKVHRSIQSFINNEWSMVTENSKERQKNILTLVNANASLIGQNYAQFVSQLDQIIKKQDHFQSKIHSIFYYCRKIHDRLEVEPRDTRDDFADEGRRSVDQRRSQERKVEEARRVEDPRRNQERPKYRNAKY